VQPDLETRLGVVRGLCCGSRCGCGCGCGSRSSDSSWNGDCRSRAIAQCLLRRSLGCALALVRLDMSASESQIRA
jgi:hypothetical protein